LVSSDSGVSESGPPAASVSKNVLTYIPSKLLYAFIIFFSII